MNRISEIPITQSVGAVLSLALSQSHDFSFVHQLLLQSGEKRFARYLQKWRFMVVLGFNPEMHDSIPKGNPDADGDRQHWHLTHSLFLTKTSSKPLFSPTAWRGRRLCPHRPEIIACMGGRPAGVQRAESTRVGRRAPPPVPTLFSPLSADGYFSSSRDN